jgi:hypothetical protein
MELKAFIRQMPIYNKQGNAIFYNGTSPYNLQATVGTLPAARQWSNYPNFIDCTNDVSDLHKIKITWTIQRDQEGVVVPGSDNVEKGVTGTLTFEGDTYHLLKSWLTQDVSAPLNSVEVKIQDTSCGYYEGFVIKPSELQWCESGQCNFVINLKKRDEDLNCVKRTLISDNWQGWFPVNGIPLNGKKHPRYSYCVEQRPNGTMIALWYIMGQVMGPMAIIMFGIALLINSLIFAINGIINVLNFFINMFGGNPIKLITFLQPLQIFNSFSIYFIETAGCGREHPAPLIRDYITNVCDRCGIKVDAVTAPIFFAPMINIETSTRGMLNAFNPHFNATYFHPQTKRGIRRFNNVNIFGTSPQNTNTFWIDDNAPLLFLDMFLDQLKGLYNAEWRVKNGKLYFQRKDYYLSGNYIYDFTENNDDRLKILEGICYEPNELKYPAAVKGLYQTDPSDMNEAGGGNGNGQMNGIANFGNTDDNPNFEGFMDKTVEFGATKFNLDGASTCYYYDALQQLANSGALNFSALFSIPAIADNLRTYADHALLLQSEIVALPKVIIWDGEGYLNARALKLKGAWPLASGYPTPTINPAYNKDNTPWEVRHTPQTKVLGSALSLGNAPDGVYEVDNLLGGSMLSNPALLINYPMYFEPYYLDTMWDWFHWIDDPLRNPVMNFNWKAKIRLCCEDLRIVGVLNDAANIGLGQKVKLPLSTFYQDGKLREITVSYDTKDTYGMYIELSGTL